MAPPHPRGSTQRRLDPDPGVDGSPAPAGIDPTKATEPVDFHRLPRTRGDRPVATSGDPAPVNGSPAPAGIDPTGSPTRS